MTPAQVNDIFRDNEVPLDEAAASASACLRQALDEQDLERWAAEHADRFAARVRRFPLSVRGP